MLNSVGNMTEVDRGRFDLLLELFDLGGEAFDLGGMRVVRHVALHLLVFAGVGAEFVL